MQVCKFYALADPRQAGALTWEKLIEMGKQYPHLIPCGARKFHWVYRETCKHCDNGRFIPPKRQRKKNG